MDQIWVALMGAAIAPLVTAVAARWSRRDLAQLRDLANDPATDPTVRREANVTLLNELRAYSSPYLYAPAVIVTGLLTILAAAKYLIYDGLHLVDIGGFTFVDITVLVGLAALCATTLILAGEARNARDAEEDHRERIRQVRVPAGPESHPTTHPDVDDETRHDA